MVIQLGRLLPAASSDLPESIKAGRLPGSRSSRRSLIWSCTGWGLQCHPGHPGCGELLPRHFTLTPRERGAVYFLLHFPWGRPRSPLATTLPCGARTFLRTALSSRRPFCLLRQVSIVAYFDRSVKPRRSRKFLTAAGIHKVFLNFVSPMIFRLFDSKNFIM